MKFSPILLFLLVIVSCNSQKEVSEKDIAEEYPKVDLNNYREVKFEKDFSIQVLKDLSPSKRESERAILGFSQLSKEKHLFIERELIKNYQISLKARGIKGGSILKTYAEEHLRDFKGVMRKSTSSEFEKSKVGDLDCLRSSFEGSSYGFPKTKFFSVRYLKTDSFIYTIVTWSVQESKEEFTTEALAMGLSFKVD